ncbi:hypothetical protein STENM36S_06761 [Streptomyces tendae]
MPAWADGPVPSTLLWLSVAAALTQALTTRIHLRDNRTSSASDRQREIPDRMVLLGLTVSFAAVWAVLASLTLERGDFGASSFSTVREELDTTFVRVILFVFDVASGFVLWALAAAALPCHRQPDRRTSGCDTGLRARGHLHDDRSGLCADRRHRNAPRLPVPRELVVDRSEHLLRFHGSPVDPGGTSGRRLQPVARPTDTAKTGIGAHTHRSGLDAARCGGVGLAVAGPLYSDLEAEETVVLGTPARGVRARVPPVSGARDGRCAAASGQTPPSSDHRRSREPQRRALPAPPAPLRRRRGDGAAAGGGSGLVHPLTLRDLGVAANSS